MNEAEETQSPHQIPPEECEPSSFAYPIDPNRAVNLLRKGYTLLKCGRTGSPHFRFFSLAEDFRTLRWCSPKKDDQEASGNLLLLLLLPLSPL